MFAFRYTEEMMKHPDNMDTMEKVARWLVTKYNERQCLGTRLLLGEEKVNNNDGKSATKFIQGEYIWITYSDLERLSRSFARGLHERGVKPRDKVRIIKKDNGKIVSKFIDHCVPSGMYFRRHSGRMACGCLGMLEVGHRREYIVS